MERPIHHAPPRLRRSPVRRHRLEIHHQETLADHRQVLSDHRRVFLISECLTFTISIASPRSLPKRCRNLTEHFSADDHSVPQARKWTTALRKHSHLTVVGALTGDAFSSVLKKICQLVITDPPPFPARRFLSVGGLLLVVGFVLFVLDGDQQKAPLPSSATREIPADLPPDATASGGPVRDVSSARAIASKSLSPDGIISTEEQRLIEKGLLKIEAEMRKVETANQTVVYDREVPGGYAVIIRMTPPTTDQMGGVSNILSAAMQNFVTGSQAGERMRERGLWMIDQYANYPKRVKMLSFSGTSDGARALLMEYFVDDEKLVMRDAVGRYRIPNPPRAVVREDSDLTKPDSWGARRYSHVFTVVGKSPGEGPGGTDR